MEICFVPFATEHVNFTCIKSLQIAFSFIESVPSSVIQKHTVWACSSLTCETGGCCYLHVGDLSLKHWASLFFTSLFISSFCFFFPSFPVCHCSPAFISTPILSMLRYVHHFSLWVMKAIPVKLQWAVLSDVVCSPWKWTPFMTVEEWIESVRPFSLPWMVSAAFILTSPVFQESRYHLNFLHRGSSQCDRGSWVKEKSSFKTAGNTEGLVVISIFHFLCGLVFILVPSRANTACLPEWQTESRENERQRITIKYKRISIPQPNSGPGVEIQIRSFEMLFLAATEYRWWLPCCLIESDLVFNLMQLLGKVCA